ncbi:MAG: type I-E CRISPR-associated protein Cas7/Cse4/CasC [Anaerolineae bacterium]|nr:type I-E CRISPR-associated protein Cas7/Cse4/CasC [Anaerolineae bacterium]
MPAETRGAAMMDDTYFNSATYYSHIRIHWEQLVANCGGKIDLARRGVKAPMLAFALVVPSGKKNSFVNQHRPDLLIAVARPNNDGQSLANAFEQPLRASNGKGYVEPSILALSNCWDQTEICYRLDTPHIAVLNPRGYKLPSDELTRAQVQNLPAWLEATTVLLGEA